MNAFENISFTEEPCNGECTFYVVTRFFNGFSLRKIRKAAERSTYVSVTEMKMLRSVEQTGNKRWKSLIHLSLVTYPDIFCCRRKIVVSYL